MVNFVLKEGDYEEIPNFLVQNIPAFANSPEYRSLSSKEKTLPGIVACALSKFLLRLHSEVSQGHAESGQLKSLEDIYDAIEKMVSVGSTEVKNLVVVEIFENIEWNEDLVPVVVSRLRPKSRMLHERWMQS